MFVERTTARGYARTRLHCARKTRARLALSVALLALLAAAAPASAFDAVLTWSKSANVSGYRIYVRHGTKAFVRSTGPTGGAMVAGADAVTVGLDATASAVNSVKYTVPDLPLGPIVYFTVTAISSTNGKESGHSNERTIGYSQAAHVVDSDGDGLTDAEEDKNLNGKRDTGETDRMVRDTDADGLADGAELDSGLNPLAADSDGDGTRDGVDTCHDPDRDGFGMPGIGTSTCPIDNCPFVANSGQLDRDTDGIGEMCDPCTNVSGRQNFHFTPTVILRKVNQDPWENNDVMVVKGEFQLAQGVNFSALSPGTKGGRITLTAFDGERFVDIALPKGTFAGGQGSRGWRLSSEGKVWKYQDKTNQRIGGISKIVIKDKEAKASRLVRVVVKGKQGNYPVITTDPPINATVTIGDQTAAMAGQCGETQFGNGECAFNDLGRNLICQYN